MANVPTYGTITFPDMYSSTVSFSSLAGKSFRSSPFSGSFFGVRSRSSPPPRMSAVDFSPRTQMTTLSAANSISSTGCPGRSGCVTTFTFSPPEYVSRWVPSGRLSTV